jgi:flagellar protein FlgJ
MPDAIYLKPELFQNRILIGNQSKNISRPEQKSDISGALNDQAELKHACEELESLFLYHLLKEMRATIPKSGFMGDNSAREMYTQMADSELARDLSSKGGIGLSAMLLRQLNPVVEYDGYSDIEKKIKVSKE